MADGCQMDSGLDEGGPNLGLPQMLWCWWCSEITFANDFDGLPLLGWSAHTKPMSGCGTRPMGKRRGFRRRRCAVMLSQRPGRFFRILGVFQFSE